HNHEHEGHNHEHEGHNHEHEGHGDEIVLSDSKAHAAGVEVGVAEPSTFHRVIKCSGQVLAAQGNESTVVASIAGVVKFNGKLTEGMKVGQGATLMTLSAKSIAAGDPVEKARVAYEVAKAEYERMEALVADKIVSAKAFAQAKEDYENARIAYEAVNRNNATSGTSVIAPLGGYVKNLLVKEGDYVSVGQPLASITQDQRLSLRADVPERHYHALNNIESANFCTPYNSEVYELKALNGRLLSYGKSSSGNSNMIPVTFEFDNRGKVMPGSFVEVYLLGAAQTDVIALPLTAITEEQGSYYIYKQVHPERYMKQLVTLGASDGTRVQILSGISAGQKVVMRGAYQVKLANTSNAIPGHSHEH
ncbi:MAG: efflux RND transporter periplasmic adaptor subunit, partial [Bacteroides sp.]|nr:efflux RND transporter periplasmic adaptor subunit [Bacteroides sp.]